MKTDPRLVALLSFHEGTAGQIAEWLEAATNLKIAAFVFEGDGPLEIDPAAENRKRISQRMEYPTRDSYKGRPFLCCRDWPERLKAMGVGKVLPLHHDNQQRLADLRRSVDYGFELVSAIHPTAVILERATIAPGVWIGAGAIIGYKAEIASGSLINTGAQIDHHSILEECTQLDPGVTTAGHVTVRRMARLHTRAVVINRVTIGERAIVGAGAVVIDDVPAGATVVGVPARIIKREGVPA
ncbi:MAG: acetyltransferase [Elusimicrobia bacterium]|nr:acetyltransferase [Elusimicrobiota bacterium]